MIPLKLNPLNNALSLSETQALTDYKVNITSASSLLAKRAFLKSET